MNEMQQKSASQPDSLIRIVDRARSGDQDAMADLMKATKNRLFFQARGYAHNDADAQEILQRAYIRAFQHLDSLADSARFVPWLSTIVTNQALLFVREPAHRYNVSFSDLSDEQSGLVFETADERIENQPELAYSARQKAEMLQEIMAQLPDEQRIAVMMYYYDQKTTKEIAAEIGCRETTVKARIRYAKDKIKEAVLSLEKKEGIKLYSLTPMAFFLALLHTGKSIPLDLTAASAAGTAVGQTAATASAAGKVSTAAAGRTAFLSTAAGRFSIAAAVAVSGGYAAYRTGIVPLAQKSEATATPTAVITVTAPADTEAPRMHVIDSRYEINAGDPLPDLSQGAAAYDVYDDCNVAVAAMGTYDINTVGTYEMQYVAKDKAGNTTSQPFTIQVNEKPAPTAASSSGSREMPRDMNFDPNNPMVAEALSLVGRTDLLCDDVVSLCLQAAGKDYWSFNYHCVGCSPDDTLQVGDVIVFYSTQDFGLGAQHNQTYGYHVVMYLGDDKCINGNYNGTTAVTACTSAKAEWIEIHRY